MGLPRHRAVGAAPLVRLKIAINAVSITEGGSVVVTEKLVGEFARAGPEHEYHVLVGTRFPSSPALEHPSVRVRRVSWPTYPSAFALSWYAAMLPRWLAATGQDVLFSVTNYLPAWSPVRTALLVQHAGYFCPSFAPDHGYPPRHPLLWGLTRHWTTRSIKRAERVTVQTHALADMISRQIPGAGNKLTVIPHGPGYLNGRHDYPATPPSAGQGLEIAYVTKYGVQKNFGVLFRALRRLTESKVSVRLHLTIDPGHQDGRRVARHAAAEGVEGHIVWHGELDREAVSRLYASAHVFVYPSICESFGFPLVEALSFSLPVVAADTAGNREICGDAALYFPPANDLRLADLLGHWAVSPATIRERAESSFGRAARFDWSVTGQQTLAWLLGGSS